MNQNQQLDEQFQIILSNQDIREMKQKIEQLQMNNSLIYEQKQQLKLSFNEIAQIKEQIIKKKNKNIELLTKDVFLLTRISLNMQKKLDIQKKNSLMHLKQLQTQQNSDKAIQTLKNELKDILLLFEQSQQKYKALQKQRYEQMQLKQIQCSQLSSQIRRIESQNKQLIQIIQQMTQQKVLHSQQRFNELIDKSQQWQKKTVILQNQLKYISEENHRLIQGINKIKIKLDEQIQQSISQKNSIQIQDQLLKQSKQSQQQIHPQSFNIIKCSKDFPLIYKQLITLNQSYSFIRTESGILTQQINLNDFKITVEKLVKDKYKQILSIQKDKHVILSRIQEVLNSWREVLDEQFAVYLNLIMEIGSG